MMASATSQSLQTLGQLLSMTEFSSDVLLNEKEKSALANVDVVGITIDSRQVKPGYLFVAVQGLHVHGKDFIGQAAANGAHAVLVDADDELVFSLACPIPVVSVRHLEACLSEIAGRFYGHPSKHVPVIGITGTNGKTTCSQLLAQYLAYLQKPCGVVGTLGCGVIKEELLNEDNILTDVLTSTGMTTSDAITTQKICSHLVERGAKALVMEVSSHGLVQHRVKNIDINTAVFTNLTHDHLDYHKTMVDYGEAKAILFAMSSVSVAVINQDDQFSVHLIEKLRPEIRLATFSIDESISIASHSKAHFYVKSTAMVDSGLSTVLSTPEGEYSVITNMVGQFNLSNLLAVVATLYMEGYGLQRIAALTPLLKPVPGRMEPIANQLGFQVVVDYAHTPDALKNALSALVPHTKARLWCVFGCGGDRDREKRPQMAAIAEKFSDEIIVTSDNPRGESPVQIFADIEKGFMKTREIIADRASAIEFAINNAEPGDVMLIAGKGHENYQLIGEQQFPFSDQQQARFSLRRREAEA